MGIKIKLITTILIIIKGCPYTCLVDDLMSSEFLSEKPVNLLLSKFFNYLTISPHDFDI